MISNRAGVLSEANSVSYRFQYYPGDVELYASIPLKPPDGGALGLAFNIGEEGGGGWDSYWLTWDTLAGTDILRIEKIKDNSAVGNIVSIPIEMSAATASWPEG